MHFFFWICWLVVWLSDHVYNSSHVITTSSAILCKYLLISQAYVLGLQIQLFSYIYMTFCWIFLLLLTQFFIPILISITFSTIKFIYFKSHELCFVNVFHSFVLLIILKSISFTSSVSFGKHVLLAKSLRVLRRRWHLSKLIING